MDSENAVEMRLNKDNSVIQANALIRSKQDNLTLLEARLIRLAISQVLKEDKDLKTFRCNISDLATFLNMDKKNVQREVSKFGETLMRKLIFIKRNEEDWTMLHWIDTFSYKKGTFTFRLSEELKPYLIGLDKLFTKYGYEEVLCLNTNYTIRLYELLASFGNIKNSEVNYYTGVEKDDNEVAFTIDYLREYFQTGKKYPSNGNFVRNIISAGVDDINEKTRMGVEYRLIKKNRVIEYVVFRIMTKEEKIIWKAKQVKAKRLKEEANRRKEALLAEGLD